MKKRDYIFIIFIVIVAVVGGLFFVNITRESGKTVTISIDGELYGEYSLFIEQEFNIVTEYGQNLLTIENGHASVTSSDCADHICEKTGKVSKNGDVICCLPHKLIIEIQ